MLFGFVAWAFCLSNSAVAFVSNATRKDDFLDKLVTNMTIPELGMSPISIIKCF